jgi:23S rRNA (cytosine1962-C5)-methyltransferase
MEHAGRDPATTQPAATATFVLAPGREKSLLNRHPWLYSGAIAWTKGDVESGATVELVAADGRFLGRGAASPSSQIRARVWTFDPLQRIDREFFETRLAASIARRAELLGDGYTAARLVHAESDGLPGLIVDRYGDWLAVQLLSAGPEAWRDTTFAALATLTDCSIFERSDAEVRALEGLPSRSGVVRDAMPRSGAAHRTTIVEHGLRFGVDIAHGQKTGFYLDQRDNRRRIGALAGGCTVLDGFSYSGGVTLNTLAGGARSVMAIDSSREALDAAASNVRTNGFDPARVEFIEADVFEHLRLLRDQGRRFELIVLDPPKLAPTVRHVERAARAYKDINLLALKLLAPGGLLATFSCSGGVGIELFQKIVAGAAVDARVDAQIIERLGPAADHPVLLSFPEGDYLKGMLLRRAG